MNRIVLFTVLSALFVRNVLAQDEEVLVTCDTKAKTLLLKYSFDSPDKGRQSKLPGHVAFWDLLTIEKCSRTDRYPGDPCRVVGMKERILSCKLGEDRYTMRFNPEPFNDDLQGRCGAVVSGSVSISKNGRPLLKRTSFDPSRDCAANGVKVISTIEVRPSEIEPRVTWAARDDL